MHPKSWTKQLTKVQIFYEQIQFSFQTTSHRVLEANYST